MKNEGFEILDLIFKGGPVMLILLGLSIISLTIILIKLIQFLKSDLHKINKIEPALKLISQNKITEAKKILNNILHPASKIVLVMLDSKNLSEEDTEDQISVEGEKELRNLEFLLKPLEVISNIAPLPFILLSVKFSISSLISPG